MRVFHYSVRASDTGSLPPLSFPLDMLRYDYAAPVYDMFDETRAVDIVSHRVPTEARWESFGWEVVPGTLRRVEATAEAVEGIRKVREALIG